MKIFVTGTGTDVGKTIVSAWLCWHFRADYWKPVQAGLLPCTDSETVAKLSGAYCHPEIYRLPLPASPHQAAAQEGVTIALPRLIAPQAENLVVEGAGGILVPLNLQDRMIDLMAQLSLPVLLVAHSGLGTINHTCLSVEALRARDLRLLGVILSGAPHPENRAAIEHYGQVPVLAELPPLAPLSPQTLRSYAPSQALQDALRDTAELLACNSEVGRR